MEGNDIINKICINNRNEWEFIIAMLDRENIENTAENFANGNAYPDYKMFGLEDEERDVASDCLNVLLRRASKKMWKGITKEQANNLMKAMHDMNVVSVEMLDTVHYTEKDIYETWKKVNEEAED